MSGSENLKMAYPPFDGIFYKEIDDQSLNLGVHFDFLHTKFDQP